MKKRPERDTIRAEYDLSKGERGRYARRFREGTNLVVLAPELAEAFPDSESVNDALRAFVRIARKSNAAGPKTPAGRKRQARPSG